MNWLVDTNVLSELIRPRPNSRVLSWFEPLEQVSVSVVTVEEIAFGLAWKAQATPIGAWMAELIDRCEVLPMTRAIAERAGTMRGDFRSQGITRAPADMIIAATAQVHALTLVTRNTRDFQGCRIALFNPFE